MNIQENGDFEANRIAAYIEAFSTLSEDKAKFILEKVELKLSNSAKTFDDIENKIFKVLAFQGIYLFGLINIIKNDLGNITSMSLMYPLFFSIVFIGTSIYNSLRGFICCKFGVTGSESNQFIYEGSCPEDCFNILLGYYCLNADKDLSENITACEEKSKLLHNSIDLLLGSIVSLSIIILIKLFCSTPG